MSKLDNPTVLEVVSEDYNCFFIYFGNQQFFNGCLLFWGPPGPSPKHSKKPTPKLSDSLFVHKGVHDIQMTLCGFTLIYMLLYMSLCALHVFMSFGVSNQHASGAWANSRKTPFFRKTMGFNTLAGG